MMRCVRTTRRCTGRTFATLALRRHVSSVAPPSAQLLREYLLDVVHDPTEGYLWNHTLQTLGRSDAAPRPRPTIDFNQLTSKWEYQSKTKEVMLDIGAAWISPFELFNPWYGRAIGKQVLEVHTGKTFKPSQFSNPKRRKRQQKFKRSKKRAETPLHIFELGGASGTVALDILNFLKDAAPAVYEQTVYTIVNPCDSVLQRQLSLLRQSHARERVSVIRADIVSGRGEGELADVVCADSCFVLGLDLFDNLPHDKVYRDETGNLHAAVVCRDSDSRARAAPTEEFRQVMQEAGGQSTGTDCQHGGVQDDLIQHTMRCIDSYYKRDSLGNISPSTQVVSEEALAVVPDASRSDMLTSLQSVFGIQAPTSSGLASTGGVPRGGAPAFIPTGAVGLFRNLRDHFPKHRLLLTGFDNLPPTTTKPGPELQGCVNPPLVSHATAGDLPSYLLLPGTEEGHTDIFFASDFGLLQHAYHQVMANQDDHNRQKWRSTAVRATEFVTEHVDVSKLALMNQLKFNPILDDFDNIQFLLGGNVQ